MIMIQGGVEIFKKVFGKKTIDINVNKNNILVDGEAVPINSEKIVSIIVEGDLVNLDSTSTVVNGNVNGSVDSTSVKVTGDINGDVDSMSITCRDINADSIDSMSINCKNINK